MFIQLLHVNRIKLLKSSSIMLVRFIFLFSDALFHKIINQISVKKILNIKQLPLHIMLLINSGTLNELEHEHDFTVEGKNS